MLDGLDAIDWSALTHAYGPASDLPGMLRAVTSPDEAVRNEALRALNSNIWHQGTVYPATAPAVPFLLELAVAREVPDRKHVLDLLRRIARGGAAERPPVVAARAAVCAGVPALLALVGADDDRVARSWALLLLSSLMEEQAAIARFAIGRIAVETDPVVRAGLAPLISALASDGMIEALDTLLVDPSLLVRQHAAAARVSVHGRVDARGRVVLLEAIDRAAELADDYALSAFGHRNGVIFDALDRLVIAGHDRELIDALLARFPRTAGHDAQDFAGALLGCALVDDGRRDLAVGLAVLEALATHEPLWTLPVGKMLAAFDVPTSRDDMRGLLAEPHADWASLRARARAIAHPPTLLDRVVDLGVADVDDRPEARSLLAWWTAALRLDADVRGELIDALATRLVAAEVCELVWRAVQTNVRGDSTGTGRAVLIAAGAHHGIALHDALIPYAQRLVRDGAPRLDLDHGTMILNGLFGTVLAGVAAACAATGAIPDSGFDGCVGDHTRLPYWRAARDAYLALLPADRRAALEP